MRVLFFAFVMLTGIQYLQGQTAGCMDPQASNYNPDAVQSDGSCIYVSAWSSPKSKAVLPPQLEEISGMTLIGAKLYGHNDSGNPAEIFEIDTTSGAITKTMLLGGATNIDWEDITNDGTYIYVGDFGNNGNGNRKDLKFYRFSIAAMNATNDGGTIPANEVEQINFFYPEQPLPLQKQGVNNTAFDCEAVVYSNGYLYIFTKNWVGSNTTQYRIPAIPQPAPYAAEKIAEFDTKGVKITSAALAQHNVLMLLGYETAGTATCSIWIISGFSDMDHLFTTGSKKRVDIGSALFVGQAEAIEMVNPTWALLSNERFVRQTPFPVDVSQQLRSLSVQPFIPQYVLPFGIENFTARLNDQMLYLNWQYLETGLVRHFVVEVAEKAADSFTGIGTVYPNASVGQYSFEYRDISNNTNRYYRIKVLQLDGAVFYSKTLSVNATEGFQFNLRAAPSPFTDKLTLSFYNDTPQTIQVSITDVSGRILNQQKLQAMRGVYSLAIDNLNNLAHGVYFITAHTRTHKFTKTVLKQ